MNHEQTAKLLKGTGFAVLKRPDGGVVTQRTANPLIFSQKSPETAVFYGRVSSRFVLFTSGGYKEHTKKLLTLGAP